MIMNSIPKIKFFYRGNCSSSHRALDWLKNHGIKVDQKRISEITSNDLKLLLSLTENGFQEVIKKSNKISVEVRQKIRYMETLSFEEAIEFLVLQSDLIRTPIILDDKKYMIGYHEEDIRKFLSSEYRLRDCKSFLRYKIE